MVNRSPLTAFAASVPSLPSPPLTAAFSKERGGRSSPPCNDVKNEGCSFAKPSKSQKKLKKH